MAANAAPSPLPLDGRVALVTGGSRGIGREVSSHLAALGARVLINYASASASASALAAEGNSRGLGGLRAAAAQAAVSDPAAVRALFDRAEEAFGSPPHVVVACAGLLNPKYPALADTTVEDFDAMFAVNVRGTFLVCREAANRVPAGGGGRIVTFSSSIMGTLLPGYAAYTATNGAVEAMTRSLAKEVAATAAPRVMVVVANPAAMGWVTLTKEATMATVAGTQAMVAIMTMAMEATTTTATMEATTTTIKIVVVVMLFVKSIRNLNTLQKIASGAMQRITPGRRR